MLLKAGTYRFNDVLDFSTWGSIDEISLPFISQDENFIIIGFYDNQLFYNTASHDDTYGVYQNYESDYMSKGWVDVAWQNTTIPKDSEVNDTFGTWYIANTNYNEVNAPVEDTIYTEKSSWYKSVADAIRSKKGTTAPILRDNFASEIESISVGEEVAEYDGTVIIEKAESVLGLRRWKGNVTPIYTYEPDTTNTEGVSV